MSLVSNSVSAKTQTQELDETQLNEFAQNNILFYHPGQLPDNCYNGLFSGLCGNTVQEKVWSILRQTLDPLHAAAAFGSIAREGYFQPVKWEYYGRMEDGTYRGVVDTSTCDFAPGMNWDDLYNGKYDGKYGVGSFGLTSGLSDYLHYINDNAPDLLQYFKDPSNTCYSDGDKLAEKIGQNEVDRLIDLEVNYFVNEWIPKYKGQGIYDTFLSYSNLDEAAKYWAKRIEVCVDCGCEDCESDSELAPRAATAQSYYDQYANYTCTASFSSSGPSSSSSSISGSNITWIGDSYSENSNNKATVEAKYPGIYYNGQSGRMFTDDDERWGPSGLNIIKNDIKGNLRNYLVFALGTNTDAGSKDDMMKNIDDLVTTAKDYNSNVKIILVSPLTNNDSVRSTYDAYRKAMQEAVAKYDNVILADWYDAAKDHLDEYFDDHIASGYTDNSTHPNTKGYEKWMEVIFNALSSADSGCITGEFVWYPQYEGPYSGITIEVKEDPTDPDSKIVKTTMGEIGCGPFSFAMMANMILPQEITPEDTMKVAIDTNSIGIQGSYGNLLTKNLSEYYGLEWKKIDSSSTEDAINNITGYLKEGWMVLTAGKGGKPYSNGGHYVGVRGIDSSGKWLLADSASEDVSKRSWNPEDVISAGMNLGNVYAFRTTSATQCDDISICKNDSNTAAATVKPVGSIHEPSVDIPCDPRTKDLGIRDDAYYDGVRYSIRLCSIPNIVDRDGSQDGNSDGHIHVNSRVSGAFYSMAEEHKKRCGNELVASEGYRTMAEQQYFWDCYQNKNCNNGNQAARPGTSNHQGGLAVDFDPSTYCSSDSSVASGSGSDAFLDPGFLSKFGLEDGRSFGENWHIQAVEQ